MAEEKEEVSGRRSRRTGKKVVGGEVVGKVVAGKEEELGGRRSRRR